MDHISVLDPGPSEEPEDTSLDRRERRKRSIALWLHITVFVGVGLLSILLFFLLYNSMTHTEEEAPSITEFHSSTQVMPVGQTARYTCNASGTPEPTVEWLHNGRPLERNGTDNQSEAWVERGFLFVRGVRSGVNTVCCMASNSAGTANHTAELIVFEEEAPSITEFHSSTQRLVVGQTARYTCNASGTPEPTVEWLHNGRPLERKGTDDQSEAWVERGFLFVRGVTYGVNTVCCMVSNSAGTANHTAELIVFDACELTLDPNTAHRRLSLSEDNRKVTRVGEDQSDPDHPERFEYRSQVLCREALTGRCYWEVEWRGSVVIGVTYRGITRRGEGDDSQLGYSNKSWGLYCDDDGYTALYNDRHTFIRLPPAGSTRVGVYLDRPAGTLSFYRVSPGGGGSSNTLTHIHTFRTTFTQEDLLPAFGVWGMGNSVSLSRL